MISDQDLIAFVARETEPAQLKDILQTIAADPENRNDLWDQVRMDEALRVHYSSPGEDEELKQAILADLNLQIPEEPPVPDAPPVLKRKNGLRDRRIWAGALAVVACLIAVVWFSAKPASQGQPPTFGSLKNIAGKVEILRDAQSVRFSKGMKLLQGDAVVMGSPGDAIIALPDGSLVSLTSKTRIRLERIERGVRIFVLKKGEISATAANPGVIIDTPEASASAAGASFTLSTEEGQTYVKVRSGVLDLDLEGKIESLKVESGRAAAATKGEAHLVPELVFPGE